MEQKINGVTAKVNKELNRNLQVFGTQNKQTENTEHNKQVHEDSKLRVQMVPDCSLPHSVRTAVSCRLWLPHKKPPISIPQ